MQTREKNLPRSWKKKTRTKKLLEKTNDATKFENWNHDSKMHANKKVESSYKKWRTIELHVNFRSCCWNEMKKPRANAELYFAKKKFSFNFHTEENQKISREKLKDSWKIDFEFFSRATKMVHLLEAGRNEKAHNRKIKF